jgi:ketosteroid isomerase-like protein
MTIASDLLESHIHLLTTDSAKWQTLIAEDLVWELPYGPSIGDPARLEGRGQVMRHVNWFLSAVQDPRFFELKVFAFADPEAAVAEVKAEAVIRSTGRIYRQEYVVFLRAAGGKIAFLREYFDPTRAALAMDKPIRGFP